MFSKNGTIHYLFGGDVFVLLLLSILSGNANNDNSIDTIVIVVTRYNKK